MSVRRLWVSVALGLAVAVTGTVSADDDQKKFAELMAAYAKAGTPGPQHKLLQPFIGQWTYTAKFWFDPSGPAMESKGTAVRKWILGGRYMLDEVEGPAFGPGEPFKGLGLTGFDNLKKKYVGLWVDSMTTALATSEGSVDSSGKTFTYYRDDIDPVTMKMVKSRDVVTVESDDRHKMVFYKTMPGSKEFKTGEIIFTRKK